MLWNWYTVDACTCCHMPCQQRGLSLISRYDTDPAAQASSPDHGTSPVRVCSLDPVSALSFSSSHSNSSVVPVKNTTATSSLNTLALSTAPPLQLPPPTRPTTERVPLHQPFRLAVSATNSARISCSRRPGPCSTCYSLPLRTSSCCSPCTTMVTSSSVSSLALTSGTSSSAGSRLASERARRTGYKRRSRYVVVDIRFSVAQTGKCGRWVNITSTGVWNSRWTSRLNIRS
jgi:hypothetical protein